MGHEQLMIAGNTSAEDTAVGEVRGEGASGSLRVARALLGIGGCAALIALLAQVRLPGNPIPITLQTVGVMLCGFWLRPRAAVSAVVLYLTLGFVGLPFFAAYRPGAFTLSLGYLVGFPVAACVISLMWRVCQRGGMRTGGAMARSGGIVAAFVVALAGTAVVFLFGVAWLSLELGGIGLGISAGLLPFLAWAMVKAGLVASLVRASGTFRDGRRPLS